MFYTLVTWCSSPNGMALYGNGYARGVVGFAGANNGVAVYGSTSHGLNQWGSGVHGFAPYGIGVDGLSNEGIGVRGMMTSDGPRKYGVSGAGLGINNVAVAGVADRGPGAKGVMGKSLQGYAGWFSGRVYVTGWLYKAGGGFQIDHPLDPENRYLRHSYVESDQQLNIYSGTVVTDSDGTAVVELPGYFEELNHDFRYQLTVVGPQFAQAIVSQEVSDNRFTVMTDRPEVKVSWQVSGVRQDRYAQANPFATEEEKPEEERGKYLHPQAWDQPEENGIDYEQWAALRDYNERPTPVPPDLPDRE
ncbi:hypothetical protein [Actinacidiphila glaucinigra]|uniref:hypothetical protein n=1 Tax=Actinacidiphila glaucinigra TaxID=235986 RepID=UPI002E36EF39|nr:hypothetical protein [Actinacidiphila glaucinigra]